MPKRLAVLLSILAMAGMAWAAAEANNAVSSTDVSATITFVQARHEIKIVNSATNPVWVKAWHCGETPVAITASAAGLTTGIIKLAASATWTYSDRSDPYCELSHITGAGTVDTFQYLAE